MKLHSYGCTNYKPFKAETIIEVRPLTLIFGKNSSGKSALLRLLRLILRTLGPKSSKTFPLDVDGLPFGTSFLDLVHGRLQHQAVQFHAKLEANERIFDLSATVQNLQSHHPPFNTSKTSQFHLRSPCAIDLNWIPSKDEIIHFNGVGPVPFRGILPDAQGALDTAQWQAIAELREQVGQLEADISHLGPFRAEIKRIYENGPNIMLGFEGAGASNQMAQDMALLDRVANWYKQHMDGWRLNISPSGIAFECTLERGGNRINLAEAGQGMQQILPIVVQQLAHQGEVAGQFIDLIEQPELHLHTAAQAPLGDLFLETAKLGRGQLIVETHSENILLRIRRRIAEGADPDLLAVYWVEDHPDGQSTVRRIHIDQGGNLDWWREGVFSEGYEEVRAISRAARTIRTPTPQQE